MHKANSGRRNPTGAMGSGLAARHRWDKTLHTSFIPWSRERLVRSGVAGLSGHAWTPCTGVQTGGGLDFEAVCMQSWGFKLGLHTAGRCVATHIMDYLS